MKTNRPIRWLLMNWNMALLSAVLISLLSLQYHMHRKTVMAQIDSELQSAMVSALPSIAPPGERRPGEPPPGEPPPGGPPRGRPTPTAPSLEEVNEEFLEILQQGNIYLVAWSPDGIPVHQFGNPPTASANTYAGYLNKQHYITRDGFRELIAPHPSGPLVVTGISLEETNRQFKRTLGTLTLIGCTIFLLGYAGGRYVIGRALKPIRQISRTAEEIAGGDHSRRIQLSDAPEELAGLARTLNDSFDHLDNAIENQKRFSADASHELRTPIAVVIAQTQAALKRERSPREYQSVLEACQRAGKRMKTMADSLLELTHIDGNRAALNLQEKDLNAVASQVAAEAAHLSDLHPVDFQELENPLMAEIDPDRMHQLLMNLVGNAIHHNPDGCAVHLLLRQEAGSAVLQITDEGAGIPAHALPHIFERFYRVDKSRSREQGGTGLGLSIVQSLVEAHGGSIEAASIPGNGTTFTIRLPLKKPQHSRKTDNT